MGHPTIDIILASARSGVKYASSLKKELENLGLNVATLPFNTFSCSDQNTVIGLPENLEGIIGSGAPVYIVQQNHNPIHSKPAQMIYNEAIMLEQMNVNEEAIIETIIARLIGIPAHEVKYNPTTEGPYGSLVINESQKEFANSSAGPLVQRYLKKEDSFRRLVNEVSYFVYAGDLRDLYIYLDKVVSGISPDTAHNEFRWMAENLYDHGAKRIHGVLPFLPHARADKGNGEVPMTQCLAKDVKRTHVRSVHTVRPHSERGINFWNKERLKMHSYDLIEDYADTIYQLYGNCLEDVIIVSPDKGQGEEIEAIYNRVREKYGIEIGYLVLNKKRVVANAISEHDILYHHNVSKSGKIDLKHDLHGKKLIFIDDMVDTLGSMLSGWDALHCLPCKTEISFFTAHTIGSYPFLEKIYEALNSGKLSYFGFSDTLDYPLLEDKYGLWNGQQGELSEGKIIRFNTAKKVAAGIAEEIKHKSLRDYLLFL